MALAVETKDTTALSDAELADMADIGVAGSAGYEFGLLSKHAEEWVLITLAHDVSSETDGPRLVGFSFCTLERIGGTPCVLVGMASVARISSRRAVLDALIGDQLRRAVLAFPDEDVLVGTCMLHPGAFDAFDGLAEIVPRPGHKASGEERAWARRLAKRFGADGRVDDRTFVVTGAEEPLAALDYESPDDDPEVVAYFVGLDHERGDRLIGFGWAMAEDLAARAHR